MNVLGFLALPDQVERRLGDVNIAALHQLRHLAIEKREQKRANMRAVHVRIGHDDDFGIAELGDVEIILADAGAQRSEYRLALARQTIIRKACKLQTRTGSVKKIGMRASTNQDNFRFGFFVN